MDGQGGKQEKDAGDEGVEGYEGAGGCCGGGGLEVGQGLGEKVVALAEGEDFLEDLGLVAGGDAVIGKAGADGAVGALFFAVEVGHVGAGFLFPALEQAPLAGEAVGGRCKCLVGFGGGGVDAFQLDPEMGEAGLDGSGFLAG